MDYRMRLGDKRPLEDGNTPHQPEKRQRVPALASVIVEAVKMDSLQKLCSTLEPLLRRVVGEEVEKALAKLVPNNIPQLPGRPDPKRLPAPESARKLRLSFRSKLALPLYTGARVEGEGGQAVHVVLQHADTGQTAMDLEESNVKLEVVVLEGDFNKPNDDDWTQEEFEQNVVKEREGKRPLLTGEVMVLLKDGVGTLGDLCFTDNSSWIRSRKFRLGVRVAPGQELGGSVRVREAKTEAFTVKDHRGELYKKHYPPKLNDEVWRLDKIGKDGAFHKRLNQSAIVTVEDFLRLIVMDPQKLRTILGSGMSNKMWEGVVEHAKTCALNGKLYVYYADEKQNIGVIFNNIFQLMGLIADGQYMSVDLLSDSEKIYVDRLVTMAYNDWDSVVEYDGEALIASQRVSGQTAGGDKAGPSSAPTVSVTAGTSTAAEGQGTATSLDDSDGPQGGSSQSDALQQQQQQGVSANASLLQQHERRRALTNNQGEDQQQQLTTELGLGRQSGQQFPPQQQQLGYGGDVGGMGAGVAGGASAPLGGGGLWDGSTAAGMDGGNMGGAGMWNQPNMGTATVAGGEGAAGTGNTNSSTVTVGPDPFAGAIVPAGAAGGSGGGIGGSGMDGAGMGGGISGWASGPGNVSSGTAGAAAAAAALFGGPGGFSGHLDDFGLSEEDLRAKSLELLENEDMHQQMQQLLGLINDYTPAGSAGTITANLQQDDNEIVFQGGFLTPSAPAAVAAGGGAAAGGAVGGVGLGPEGASHLKHTSKVGWLKLRAALRWGIFIRKRAAQRRAQIVQLDDDDES
ncbi:hypothetical protein CLOM_g988 [Closterium sp. NIES-68]|nr:hypothetical protein CLOM_g988 [Closterium sp. NIES-68]GJP70338.1 hypothetical protein CLOP_g1283 [Closterium sp. NIES-67]